jgi:hypothetical protein
MFLMDGFASPSLLRPERSGRLSFWYLDSEGVFCLISGGENPVVDNLARGEKTLRVRSFLGPCQARFTTTVCPHRCRCQWSDSASSSHPSSASFTRTSRRALAGSHVEAPNQMTEDRGSQYGPLALGKEAKRSSRDRHKPSVLSLGQIELWKPDCRGAPAQEPGSL